MTHIAMIPARLGSTRVERKNLRFLGDKPLLAWVTETALRSRLFSAVYVNSESEEIGALATNLGAKFYRRDPLLATDEMTSEHFVADFMKHVACDTLFQLTPTSPFISETDLQRACALIDGGANTVLSTKLLQAECIFRLQAMNFQPREAMRPSQELEPVRIMCNGIFGWRVSDYTNTYGHSNVAMLDLTGDSTTDIDTEQDFVFAEYVLASRDTYTVKRYWSPTTYAETNATEVLAHDGVSNVDLQVNDRVNLEELLANLPRYGGARRVVQRMSNSATVISQQPGEGNRRHYHSNCDEWWLILEGEYEYEIEGVHTKAVKGDIISIERGKWHQIRATGYQRATRLAVSRDNVSHIYHD